jgi:hypothetical protein
MTVDLHNLSTQELRVLALIGGFVGRMATQVLADRSAAEERLATINRQVAEENSGNAR